MVSGLVGDLPTTLGTWVYPSAFVSSFCPIGEVAVAPYFSHVLTGRPRRRTGKEEFSLMMRKYFLGESH